MGPPYLGQAVQAKGSGFGHEGVCSMCCPLAFKMVHHVLNEAWLALYYIQSDGDESCGVVVGPSPVGVVSATF